MREGVNKVVLCLFEHNEKAYRAAVWMMEQYSEADIVHPTCTGKKATLQLKRPLANQSSGAFCLL